jgi:hypothetical protein
MESILGASTPVFIGVTVILFGGAAWMTGKALAVAWKPSWQGWLYGLLLGAGARFITYALFQGELLSPSGYVLSTAVILLDLLIAFCLYRTHRMIQQYPWLYERYWLLSWHEKRSNRR